MISRRRLLKNLALGTCGSLAHSITLGGIKAFATSNVSQHVANDKILILLELGGGVSPNIAHSELLRSHWSNLWPQSTFNLARDQHLHGALEYVNELWKQGQMLVLNQVGLVGSRIDGSHPGAMKLWQSAHTGISEGSFTGWMTRAGCCVGEASEFATISVMNKGSAVSGYCENVNLQGSNPTSIDGIAQTGLWSPKYGKIRAAGVNDSLLASNWANLTREFIGNNKINADLRATGDSTASDEYIYLTKEANGLDLINDAFTKLAPSPTSPEIDAVNLEIADFLNNIGRVRVANSNNADDLVRDVQDIGRIIATSLVDPRFKPRLILSGCGGFDTHGAEIPTLQDLLRGVNLAVKYLATVCKFFGIWDKVVIMTTSEFSRSIDPGGVGGSEHGGAGPMLIMGGKVNGGPNGYISAPPEGYVNNNTVLNGKIDFRQIFFDVLDGHLNFDIDIIKSHIITQDFVRDSGIKLFRA